MSQRFETARCEHCRRTAEVPVDVTFLGFRRFGCPGCGKSNTLPLTSGYRTTYFVVLALMICSFVYISANGQVPLPGFIGIAVIVALIRDFLLRRRLQA